jgi:hypothetical protein
MSDVQALLGDWNMTDRLLLRSLVLDFASGVALGAVFAGFLLVLNVQHLLDAVRSSGSPMTLGVILIAGCAFHFEMGATITGLPLALMSNEVGRS